jgi:hypothetical protein
VEVVLEVTVLLYLLIRLVVLAVVVQVNLLLQLVLYHQELPIPLQLVQVEV